MLDVTASTGARFQHTYDGEERSPVELVDAEGGVTRMTVRDGLVRAIEDPDGVRLAFGFDADGNLVSATDADGNVARLERDAGGVVLAAVSPAGAPHDLRPRRARPPCRAPRARRRGLALRVHRPPGA